MGERNWDSYHRWSKTGDGWTEFSKWWLFMLLSRQPWSSTFRSTRKSVLPCSEPKCPWPIPCHVPISIKIWPEIPDEIQPWDSVICPNTRRIAGLSGSVREKASISTKDVASYYKWTPGEGRWSHCALIHLVSASRTRSQTEILNCSRAKISQTPPPVLSEGFCWLLSGGRSQAEDVKVVL